MRFKDSRAAHQFVYKALSEALSTLPAAPALDQEAAPGSRALNTLLREPEQDLFSAPTDPTSTPSSASFSKAEVANDSEQFLGVLRSGHLAWDGGKGLWLAPPASLSMLDRARALAELAEQGTLCACQQLIPARCLGLTAHAPHLMSRKNQLQSMGIELEWMGADEARITFAPEGFDNCRWEDALPAMALCFAKGRLDALSLSMALCLGIATEPPDEAQLWGLARQWMDARRLARELPGSFFVALPPPDIA
jgi:hypothetical protein